MFWDEQARFLSDPDHSEEEDRFILLGLSAALRVLVVIHTYREDRKVIRVISARKASRKERSHYAKRVRT